MITRQHMIVACIALVAVGCAGAGPRTTSHGKSPTIRVLLAEGANARVMTPAAYEVRSGGTTILRGPGREELTFTATGPSSIQVNAESGGVAATNGSLQIVTIGEVKVKGIAYGGTIMVSPRGNVVQVINTLTLEHYLEGVLPHEIGTPGPDAYAALQAQAVTARTYALMRMEARKSEPFDVYSGVTDQVYGGHSRESRLTTAAVRETHGMVLTYAGRLSGTYYSACCGGHTSDIRVAWPKREGAPYLYGIADSKGDGAFCADYKRFRWRYSFTGKELGAIIRRTIPSELKIPESRVGRFVDIRITRRDHSGRVRRLEVETTRGTFTVEADRIRWVLMLDVDAGKILPSTMFDIETRKRGHMVNYVSIIGGGNGHGVGMCQNGALAMARKGYTYEAILNHYYPKTQTQKRY